MSAKYEIYKDIQENFRFRLKAGNNKIIVVSEAYENKTNCINGVKSIQQNCQANVEDKTLGQKISDPKYEIFVDSDLMFRFNLVAPNGRIVGSSEAYKSKQGSKNGIEAVKNSCDAKIVDLTTTQQNIVSPKEIEQCQYTETTGIAMMSPPNVVESGSVVTFEGWLINNKTGEGIKNAKIDIIEYDRSFLPDKILISGNTAEDGSFSIEWEAHPGDWWDNSVEVYSKFSGKQKCKPTRSANYTIKVV